MNKLHPHFSEMTKTGYCLSVVLITSLLVLNPFYTLAEEQEEQALGEADTEEFKNRTVMADFGRHFLLACGPKSALHCSITSPDGEETVFHRQCSLQVYVTSTNIGVWTCNVILPSESEGVVFTTTLYRKDDIPLEIEAVEDESKVTMVCKYPSKDLCYAKPNACVMERPTGEKINLREGDNSTSRYKLVGGGFESCDCSMTIQKPLANEDYGYWKCIMNIPSLQQRSSRGGFINLQNPASSNDSEIPVQISAYKYPKNGGVRPGAEFVVGWKANRPIDYCWLKRVSKGEHYFYDNIIRVSGGGYDVVRYTGMGIHLGECLFTKRMRNAERAEDAREKWIFAMGIQEANGTIMERKDEVTITVTDAAFFPTNPVVEVSHGYAMPECLLASGQPLDICSFIAPNGNTVTFVDGYSEDRYRQFGPGLQHGSCAFEIRNVRNIEYGNWACHARSKGKENYRAQFKVAAN